MSDFTEDHLIEQPAIQLMCDELDWTAVNAYDEWAAGVSSLGREAKWDVVLVSRLRPVLESLNPDAPAVAAEFLQGTLDEAQRIRQDMVTVAKALLGESA
jgi:hypothetical protein